MLHHRNRLIRIEIRLSLRIRQPIQTLLGLFILSPPDEPPRAFRRKQDETTEDGRPHQLKVVRELPGHVVCPAELGFNDADADDLAEAPAEVDVGGEVLAEGDGHDFRGVGDGH